MHEVTTVAGTSSYVERESQALFRVTGRGVHNPEFQHRVTFYSDGKVLLSAQSTVIALHAIPTSDYRAGTVAIGDTLLVDGTEYVVTARPLADPELVPVGTEAPAVKVKGWVTAHIHD